MFAETLITEASALLAAMEKKGLKLATAESCTGGLISSLFTDIAGSSSVFDRGFISYSYESKTDQLAVDAKLILEQGAVSEDVVSAMVRGALKNSLADFAIAVTGIAGPGGGTAQKPVGLVYIAVAGKAGYFKAERCQFAGGRSQVRVSTVAHALTMLKTALSN